MSLNFGQAETDEMLRLYSVFRVPVDSLAYSRELHSMTARIAAMMNAQVLPIDVLLHLLRLRKGRRLPALPTPATPTPDFVEGTTAREDALLRIQAVHVPVELGQPEQLELLPEWARTYIRESVEALTEVKLVTGRTDKSGCGLSRGSVGVVQDAVGRQRNDRGS